MYLSLIYGFAAGVIGTVAGALIPLFFNVRSDSACSGLMSFAAGFMLSVVFCDLFPESALRSSVWVALLSAFGGGIFVALLSKAAQKPILLSKKNSGDAKFFATGIMILLAIGLHNLPEGLAIGSLEALDKGLVMAILIGFHNIPEGIAMSAPLHRSGMRGWKIALLCAASGVPTVIGAAIGFLAGNVSDMVIAVCLGVAAGAMSYIVFGEMLPEAYDGQNKTNASLLCLAGLITGIILINLL